MAKINVLPSSMTNSERWVAYTRARREFLPAFKTAWPYTLLGLITGSLLFLWQHHWVPYYGADNLGMKLLEHLGVGFWVSAIAVFFYEWGAHVKKTVKLSERLVRILTVKANAALRESLADLLGEESQILQQKLVQLVNAISHLQQQRTWVGKGYLGVVEWLLDAVVLQNVNSFENLEGGAWWPFTVPPNSAEMADQILAAQMRVMKSGDRYDVISDVQSWREGGLEAFIQASSDAIVKRGVVVRRIFNLFRSDLPEQNNPLYQDKCQEMIEILNTHIRYATQAEVDGRYEVKVFWTDSTGRLKGKALRLREKFKMAHFGLFRQNEKPNTIICVKVEEDDLSDMLLSWDGRAVALNLKYFKEMWKVGTPLDPTELDRIATRLMPNRSKEKQ